MGRGHHAVYFVSGLFIFHGTLVPLLPSPVLATSTPGTGTPVTVIPRGTFWSGHERLPPEWQSV